jgi:hypothetical protein
MWAEAFFEVFTTALLAYFMVMMGFVSHRRLAHRLPRHAAVPRLGPARHLAQLLLERQAGGDAGHRQHLLDAAGGAADPAHAGGLAVPQYAGALHGGGEGGSGFGQPRPSCSCSA